MKTFKLINGEMKTFKCIYCGEKGGKITLAGAAKISMEGSCSAKCLICNNELKEIDEKSEEI